MPLFITTIQTNLPATEVRQRLGALIEERSPTRAFLAGSWAPARPGAVFAGTCGEESFKAVPLIRYRNSFLPVIRGRFVQGNTGTDVRLVMTLPPVVAVFLVLWCAGLIFGVARGLADSSAPGLIMLFPIAMCGFGLFVTAAGFFPEAVKAARVVRGSLQG